MGERISAASDLPMNRGLREDVELRLLDRVRDGDTDAFETLFKLYHPRLVRFLSNLVRRPTIVEEVLSDTMVVVWERADSFRRTSRLSTWIFAIAYRKAMKSLRRQDEPLEDMEQDGRAAQDPTPEEDYGHGTARRLLLAAMEELPPNQRSVVDLCYFHELGYREIAEIMGCPVDTVKTRMFHARRHLRRKLAGELGDWIYEGR